METLINIGQELALHAQLSDGVASMPLRVKAFIKAPAGTLIALVELTHTGQGLFIDNTFLMPDLPFVIVQYVVFEDDNITPSANYSMGVAIFRNSAILDLGGGEKEKTLNVTELTAEVSDIQTQYIVEVSDVTGN